MKDAINRDLLRESLDLGDKLDRDYYAIFPNHNVPIGHHYKSNGRKVANFFQKMTVVIAKAPVGLHRKSSAHRIFVVCRNCGRQIPAGRWHQHRGTKICP